MKEKMKVKMGKVKEYVKTHKTEVLKYAGSAVVGGVVSIGVYKCVTFNERKADWAARKIVEVLYPAMKGSKDAFMFVPHDDVEIKYGQIMDIAKDALEVNIRPDVDKTITGVVWFYK